MGFLSKAAADFKNEIKKLMFSSDKTPVPVVEDQGRFAMIMAAFHQYERAVRFLLWVWGTGDVQRE